MSLHPSERAIFERERNYDWVRSIPAVPPGTTTEWDAVATLDAQRQIEQRELRAPSRAVMGLER